MNEYERETKPDVFEAETLSHSPQLARRVRSLIGARLRSFAGVEER
ncbi:hypothetical protein ACH9L7_09580 [Haloferax sp. S1W]